MPDPTHAPDHTDVTTDDVAFGLRDRLLLAFAELQMYGIDAQAAVEAAPARARAAITARLRARAPHGLGSYVFWTWADEDRLGDPAELVLHTSGPEVNRAVVAALARHGLTARPGPRPGMLLVG